MIQVREERCGKSLRVLAVVFWSLSWGIQSQGGGREREGAGLGDLQWGVERIVRGVGRRGEGEGRGTEEGNQ